MSLSWGVITPLPGRVSEKPPTLAVICLRLTGKFLDSKKGAFYVRSLPPRSYYS